MNAGNEAGMVHYRKAGALLLEAKEQVKHGEWTNWVSHHFDLSRQTAQIYMNLASAYEKASTTSFSSLGEFVRQTSNPNYNKPHTVRPTPWHEPVKQAAESVNVERMNRAGTIALGGTLKD